MDSSMLEEGSWLEKVHDIILWSVVAPRINTPFGCGVPTPLLRKFIEDREVLKRHVGLRGMVDGHEFMLITNLKSLSFFSDHFIVSKMRKGEVDSYLATYGIYDWVERELNGLQSEYAEELARRQKEHTYTAAAKEETIKERRRRLAAKNGTAKSGQFNRFYSGGAKAED